jgi:hypothetical protein
MHHRRYTWKTARNGTDWENLGTSESYPGRLVKLLQQGIPIKMIRQSAIIRKSLPSPRLKHHCPTGKIDLEQNTKWKIAVHCKACRQLKHWNIENQKDQQRNHRAVPHLRNRSVPLDVFLDKNIKSSARSKLKRRRFTTCRPT